LIFVCGIAKFLYPPNRKRKEESERLLQSWEQQVLLW
jgi:hypothetical protein